MSLPGSVAERREFALAAEIERLPRRLTVQAAERELHNWRCVNPQPVSCLHVSTGCVTCVNAGWAWTRARNEFMAALHTRMIR